MEIWYSNSLGSIEVLEASDAVAAHASKLTVYQISTINMWLSPVPIVPLSEILVKD